MAGPVLGRDLNDWCRAAKLYGGEQMVTRIVLDIRHDDIVEATLYVEEYAPAEVMDSPPDLSGAEVEVIPGMARCPCGGSRIKEPYIATSNPPKEVWRCEKCKDIAFRTIKDSQRNA